MDRRDDDWIPPTTGGPGTVELSILLPTCNEEPGLGAIVRETVCVLHGLGRSFEILVVDDGSDDWTPRRLNDLCVEIAELRAVRLATRSGRSAALLAAFRAARGKIFVTLDADGQSNPTDIPALVAGLGSCDVCCGYRVGRRDAWSGRTGSRLAHAIRKRILRETIRDPGCSLLAFRAEWAAHLPLQFRGLHRFIPNLLGLAGARIAEIPVHPRPLSAGQGKNTGHERLGETLRDLWAVRWMQQRYRPIQTEPLRWTR